jgi:hypothetical protein
MRAGGLLCEEAIWNFGTIDSVKNPQLSHEFLLTNESQEKILIEKIHSTCGCMVADGYEKEILPGRNTKLRVNVQLQPTPGMFHKSLAVQVGGAKITVLPLEVIGEIIANASMYSVPAKINFGTIRPGETKERTVQILRYDLSPIKIRETKSESHLKTEITPQSNDHDNYQVNLRVQLTANDIQPGNYDWSIKVITDHPNSPEYNIPVSVIVEETK